MPRFHSRDFPRPPLRFINGEVLPPDPLAGPGGIEIDGRTLGELIAHLEATTSIQLIAADPPKYFLYKNLTTGEEEIVDVHIYRRDEMICPKQDLNFPLQPDDIVEAGMLVC